MKLLLPISPLQRLMPAGARNDCSKEKTRSCKHQSKITSTLHNTTKTSAAETMPTLVPLLTFVSASGDGSSSWSRYCIAPGTCPASCSRDRVFCKEKPQALNPPDPPRRSTQEQSHQGWDLVPPPPGRADTGISAGLRQTDHKTSSW